MLKLSGDAIVSRIINKRGDREHWLDLAKAIGIILVVWAHALPKDNYMWIWIVLLFSGIEYVQAASSLAILAIALIPAMIANFYINIVMIPLKLEKRL